MMVMPDGRPDWDLYFLQIAQAVALRGDCRRRKVGAVLVTNGAYDPQVMSTGCNGPPPGVKGCLSGNCPRGRQSLMDVPSGGSYDEGPGFCIAVHAEEYALVRAGASPSLCQGTVLYVTEVPCVRCERLALGSGAERIVTPFGEITREANRFRSRTE